MHDARRSRATIAFMAVWLCFWLGGIIVAFHALGAAALAGERAAALFLVAWLGAAAVGLVAAARRLVALLTGAPRQRRAGTPRHDWQDGMPRRPEG